MITISHRNYSTLDTSSGTCVRVLGPVGATHCLVYATGTSYAQTGETAVDGADLAAQGGPIPAGSWCSIPCGPNDADSGVAGRPAVGLQSSTSSMRVRFTIGGI